MPLAYGQKGTYSIKYNILFDKLFGLKLIGQDVCERETDYYIQKNQAYGVPLDTRETYTKADWILWAAALTDDKEKSEALYLPVVRYLKESSTRVPFGDWYYAGGGHRALHQPQRGRRYLCSSSERERENASTIKPGGQQDEKMDS